MRVSINRNSAILPVLALAAALGALRAQQPDQAEFGKISGTVYDGGTGHPIQQAVVEVQQQPNQKVITDLNGKYELTLPAGTYSLRISAPRYLTASLENLQVKNGEVAEGSTVLAAANDVTTVDVVERLDAVAASASALLAERKLAPSVSDGISAEEVRKSVASDVAAALEKVTGVSVVGNGYVYVRGLGERYSATMLNNALIPTTDPERRVVPLDLFPASLMENIKILKSYTPDLPGEFSGGLVQMNTIEFPTQRILRISVNSGFNTATTFRPFLSYPGGSRDFFGFDDGSRALPQGVPASPPLFAGNYSPQQLQQFGRLFPVNWEPVARESMRPSQSYSVVAGDTFGRLGVVGAIAFANSPQRIDETQRYYVNQGGGQPFLLTDYPQFNVNSEGIRLGAALNAALKLNEKNKLVFRNTLTRDTDKEARSFAGYNGGTDTDILAQRLRWVENSVLSTSVEGSHLVERLGNSILNWQFTYSLSNRFDPDLREVVRGRREDGTYSFLALPSSGLRFYSDLNDRIYEPQASWSKPFYRGSVSGLLKVGVRSTIRRRDFNGRRFRFIPVRSITLNLTDPSNLLLGPENIRPDGFEIRENTRGTDSYTADMDVHAGYIMADISLGSRWRLVGGVRLEDTAILVNTVNPLIPGSVPVVSRLDNRDVMPAVNAIYSLTSRQNVRLAYGRTVNRPDFRELSPFEFLNALGGFTVIGNPNLVRTRIDNFDARWEWFPAPDEIIAAGYFLKNFDDPIEVSVSPVNSDLRESFLNADGARNQGIELEFRKNLRFLSRRLSSLAVFSNFTVVDSNVRLPAATAGLLTSQRRPLVGQSRYIGNFSVDWARPQWKSSARFFVNSVSRRITDVGTFGLPDIYQERNTFLDFVYQYDIRESGRWSIRFSAENLLDNHYLWTQAGLLHREYYLGRTFRIGTTISVF